MICHLSDSDPERVDIQRQLTKPSSPLQVYFQNMNLAAKPNVHIRRSRRTSKSHKRADPTQEVLGRFIKKTRAQGSGYEEVDDARSGRSGRELSKPETLRETLSRHRRKAQNESADSNMIDHLKQNILCKSHLGTGGDSWLAKSEFSELGRLARAKQGNSQSVFRFNKFENEKKKKKKKSTKGVSVNSQSRRISKTKMSFRRRLCKITTSAETRFRCSKSSFSQIATKGTWKARKSGPQETRSWPIKTWSGSRGSAHFRKPKLPFSADPPTNTSPKVTEQVTAGAFQRRSDLGRVLKCDKFLQSLKDLPGSIQTNSSKPSLSSIFHPNREINDLIRAIMRLKSNDPEHIRVSRVLRNALVERASVESKRLGRLIRSEELQTNSVLR